MARQADEVDKSARNEVALARLTRVGPDRTKFGKGAVLFSKDKQTGCEVADPA
jgi:hypothetical protein